MSKTIFEKSVFNRKGVELPLNDVDFSLELCVPQKYRRKEKVRLPEVSELDVMRHYIGLSTKNHYIEKGFYPLGSCTMKYNPKINENIARRSEFIELHPYQSQDDIQGALEIIYDLQKDLSEISGMSNVTLQPLAGAQGEFAGLRVISAYHKYKNNKEKSIIIMPDSAHGTNPASCMLNGFEVIELKSDDKGMVDINALKDIIDKNGNKIAGFMLTNPNTLGIFESNIEKIADLIHSVDGLMYMDGANFNALLGLVKPGEIGFDIMHYNLHKTFATPHGGGGPGSGPIGVRKDLVKFLPIPLVSKKENKFFFDFSHKETSIGKLQTFNGNFSQNLRAYVYIKMLGSKGMKDIAINAIINANYILNKLIKYYDIPFKEGCMHEFVASAESIKKNTGVKTIDIAKRLLDKGFHAPTVYFPLIVHEAIMIEPTETESKQTLDEFINAMIEIYKEASQDSELLFNAPFYTPVKRVDDTKAVRDLDVRFKF